MEARQGMSVTYTGSDGQRHHASILALWPDGSATIRRGYYDPMAGTRTTFRAADDVRDYVTGKRVTFGGPSALSPFVHRALARELPAKAVTVR